MTSYGFLIIFYDMECVVRCRLKADCVNFHHSCDIIIFHINQVKSVGNFVKILSLLLNLGTAICVRFFAKYLIYFFEQMDATLVYSTQIV